MTDTLTRAQRRHAMARVWQNDTGPEVLVRRALHRLGYRFRLRRRDLPGTPDIVLPKWRTVIFVHGCFWHQHAGCLGASPPQTNQRRRTRRISIHLAHYSSEHSRVSCDVRYDLDGVAQMPIRIVDHEEGAPL